MCGKACRETSIYMSNRLQFKILRFVLVFNMCWQIQIQFFVFVLKNEQWFYCWLKDIWYKIQEKKYLYFCLWRKIRKGRGAFYSIYKFIKQNVSYKWDHHGWTPWGSHLTSFRSDCFLILLILAYSFVAIYFFVCMYAREILCSLHLFSFNFSYCNMGPPRSYIGPYGGSVVWELFLFGSEVDCEFVIPQ